MNTQQALMANYKNGVVCTCATTDRSGNKQIELRHADGALIWRGWEFEPDYAYYLEQNVNRYISIEDNTMSIQATQSVNMRHMVNVYRSIKAQYTESAATEKNIIHSAESLQRINRAFVQAIAEADECKLLKHKRQIILDAIEDGDRENIHLYINAAAIILGDDRMLIFRKMVIAFHCMSKAATFAEYSQHRAHYLKLRNVFIFRFNNIFNNASQRLNAALNWVEYYNKLIYAAARMPKSGLPKSDRKLLTRLYINNRVTKPEYTVTRDTTNRVIYARLAVILKRGIERSYINASTCASIKSAVQFHKSKDNYYHPMHGLAAVLSWAQADRKAYLRHSPQGRTLYINRLPV